MTERELTVERDPEARDASASPGSPVLSLVASGLAFLAAVIVGWSSLGMGASEYEPYGPATFPVLICTMVAILAAASLVVGFRRLPGPLHARVTRVVPWTRALGFAAITIVYVIALQHFKLNYLIATAIFIFAAIWVQKAMSLRSLVLTLVGAALAATVLTYAFTRIVVVPLPL